MLRPPSSIWCCCWIIIWSTYPPEVTEALRCVSMCFHTVDWLVKKARLGRRLETGKWKKMNCAFQNIRPDKNTNWRSFWISQSGPKLERIRDRDYLINAFFFHLWDSLWYFSSSAPVNRYFGCDSHVVFRQHVTALQTPWSNVWFSHSLFPHVCFGWLYCWRTNARPSFLSQSSTICTRMPW